MKTVLDEVQEHLQRDVELSFLRQKDVDRINYYIDTFFKEKEKQQVINAYNQGYREGEVQEYNSENDVSQFDDAENYFKETFTCDCSEQDVSAILKATNEGFDINKQANIIGLSSQMFRGSE